MKFTRDQVQFTVDETRCERCRLCAAICPGRVFSWVDETIAVNQPARCIGCGHCVAICPTGAFDHRALAREKFLEADGDRGIDRQQLSQWFLRRRSCRLFTDELLSKQTLEQLIDQARYAPTPTNSRNVRFLVLNDKEAIGQLARWTTAYYLRLERRLANPLIRLAISMTVGFKTVRAYRYHFPMIAEVFRDTQNGEDRLFYGAPAVIIACASGMPHIAVASCNQSAMQLMLAAEAAELGTCFNGYALTALFRRKNIRKKIGIPQGYTPGAVLAVGRPKALFKCIPPRNRCRVIWPEIGES